MLLRIFLAIAILAGIATTVLNLLPVKDKITGVMAERDDWHRKADDTQKTLVKTQGDLKKTQGDLEKANKSLTDARAERDSERTAAATEKKRADGLDKNLKEMTAKYQAADQQLSAWAALGITTDQVRATLETNKLLVSTSAMLARDKQLLQNQVNAKEQELQMYRDPEYRVPLPPDLVGKVIKVDPKFGFVVLDVGQRQGVLAQGQMLVSREGKLVAQIRIKEVEPDRAIANVVWKHANADVYEGDVVVTR